MSVTSKQDMSMDEILASIRSYVSEGQSHSKNENTPFAPTEKISEKKTYEAEVIQLTDEVIPIETISLSALSPSLAPLTPLEKSVAEQSSGFKPTLSPFQDSVNFDNPFNRLQSEIVASTPASPTLSTDELLNQLATPLIKNWLDQNLRKIVENTVEKEIERIKRGSLI